MHWLGDNIEIFGKVEKKTVCVRVCVCVRGRDCVDKLPGMLKKYPEFSVLYILSRKTYSIITLAT
jgi:hypothetical protein